MTRLLSPTLTSASRPEPGPVASASPVRAQTTRPYRVRPHTARLDVAAPTPATRSHDRFALVVAGGKGVGAPRPVRAAGAPTRDVHIAPG